MLIKTTVNCLFNDILFSHRLFWLKNWRFSTKICKGFIVYLRIFFNKRDQTRSFLTHLLKKSLMENFIFCAMDVKMLESKKLYFTEGAELRWQFSNCFGTANRKHIGIIRQKNSRSNYYDYQDFCSICICWLWLSVFVRWSRNEG